MQKTKESIHSVNSMSLESDADLLTLTSFKEDDKVISDLAFREFYKRYSGFILGACEKLCLKHTDRKTAIEETFSATILRVYKSCDTFSSKGSNDLNEIKLKIKAWLFTIARNEYLKWLAGEKKYVNELNEYCADITAANKNISKSSRDSEFKEAIKKALKTLSPRDTEIYLSCMEYKTEGRKLPSDLIKSLSKRFQTTSENMRQICKRCSDKIHKYLENMGLKTTQDEQPK